MRNWKHGQLDWKAVNFMEWPFSSLVFLPPSIHSTSSMKTHSIWVTSVSHLVTDMQNDTLHSTLVASFTQEYPSPLQTIMKPLHPHQATWSSLYRWGSTEPRKVNLPRSQELVTELRRKPHQQKFTQHLHSPSPMMADLGIQGEPCPPIFLVAHSPLAP